MTSLTIGVFDGVHRGHQLLFSYLSQQAIVMTFSNHPAEIIKLSSPPLLSSIRLKLALMKEYNIQPLVIPFTHELSALSYDDFLRLYCFDHLILGDGAVLGKNGRGNASTLEILGLQRGFTLQIIRKLNVDGQIVSSTRIRSLIQQGQLGEAEKLLGRPHCFEYFPESTPHQRIVLPPDGEYFVWSHSKSGVTRTKLIIRDQIPQLCNQEMQLISFGPHLNPKLFDHLCQISLAV